MFCFLNYAFLNSFTLFGFYFFVCFDLLHLSFPTYLLVDSLFFPSKWWVKRTSEIIYIISSTYELKARLGNWHTGRNPLQGLDFLFWKHIQTWSTQSHNKCTNNFLPTKCTVLWGRGVGEVILLTITLRRKKNLLTKYATIINLHTWDITQYMAKIHFAQQSFFFFIKSVIH